MSKSWKLKAKGSNETFEFIPVFETKNENTNTPDVECVDVIMRDGQGKEHHFNFVNLFQFIYFISNEELRRGLAMRYQRRVNYIPYDVSFKLDKEEIDRKAATRRINLPVDELTMAVARNEAWKLLCQKSMKLASGSNPAELFPNKRSIKQ